MYDFDHLCPSVCPRQKWINNSSLRFTLRPTRATAKVCFYLSLSTSLGFPFYPFYPTYTVSRSAAFLPSSSWTSLHHRLLLLLFDDSLWKLLTLRRQTTSPTLLTLWLLRLQRTLHKLTSTRKIPPASFCPLVLEVFLLILRQLTSTFLHCTTARRMDLLRRGHKSALVLPQLVPLLHDRLGPSGG